MSIYCPSWGRGEIPFAPEPKEYDIDPLGEPLIEGESRQSERHMVQLGRTGRRNRACGVGISALDCRNEPA